jgi:PAS domain S-box-containing protein
VSGGIQQIVGMTAEQVMADARAFEALILEGDRRGLRATADAAMATMSPFEIEIRQRTLRGDIRWVHRRATPRQRLADGSVIWGGAVVDVTERKRVEEELREREALLRALSDNLPDGTLYQVVRRPDGSNYFPYLSAGQASTYGLTREQAIAEPLRVYGLVVGATKR